MAARKDAGVQVALSRIERALGPEERDGVFLLLRPDRAQRWSSTGNPAVMAAFEAAIVHANASTPEESAQASFTAPTPKGPAVYLDPPGDTPAETQIWLTALADHLTSAGIGGTLGVAPQDGGPDWLYARRAQPELTAFHGYRLSTPYPAGTPKPWTLAWAVDPVTTDALCQYGVGWCAEVSGGDSYLAQGLSQIRFDGPGAAKILAATMAQPSPGDAALTSAREHPLAARRFQLSYWGEAVFQIDGEPQDWRTRLDAVTETLLARPADLDLAIVRLTLPRALGWSSLNRASLPYVDEIHVVLNRHLWHRYTPDASGLQILTDEHLARAADLSAWEVEPVAPGRYLVRAKDLAPWYSGNEPDPAVLEPARRDFGPMILTPEIIAAENR